MKTIFTNYYFLSKWRHYKIYNAAFTHGRFSCLYIFELVGGRRQMKNIYQIAADNQVVN